MKLASVLVLLSCLVYWRGEPHTDIDPLFVGVNVLLIVGAFAGLTFFGWFIDIFASLGYGALCFGICRGYSAVMRGRASGNVDYLPAYDPQARPWLLLARLRLEPAASLSPEMTRRRRREYRRVVRRFVWSSPRIVKIEGVVERKHWMQAILDDLLLLTWQGTSEADVRAQAGEDLAALHAALDAIPERLGSGHVVVCTAAAQIDDGEGDAHARRLRLRALLGQNLDRLEHWPLAASNPLTTPSPACKETDPCETPSAP